jgi:hypothetical protein
LISGLSKKADYSTAMEAVMKYWILFFFMALFRGLNVNAQVPNPTPQLNPITTGSRSNIRIVRDSNNTFDQLRSLEIQRKKEELPINNPLNELKRIIYRKPSKEEIQIFAPSPSLFEKYALFLRQPDVGIIKLNSDSSCVENSEIVTLKEACLQYAIPGAGTAYSFRVESYRLPRLADLILSKGILKTDGVLQQGMMVNLGNISLQEVTLQTKGLKYLLDFKPVADVESLLKIDRELSKGIEADGFLYRLGFYVNDQVTFALRSIAYKGKYMRSVKGILYNELDFDKRKDILVAFSVVETDANGNITILWKMLSQGNAPTLKIK